MGIRRRFLARGAGKRAIPWLTVWEIARVIYKRGRAGWGGLSPHEQAELRRIVSDGRRSPRSVPPHDRVTLRRIVLKAARKATIRV